MKWISGLVVVALLVGQANAFDFWLTNDPAGSSVADFTIDVNDGPFSIYAYVNTVDDLDTVRMWSGVMPDIAEIVDVQMDVGIPQAVVVLPDETLYGSTAIGLNGVFRLATITVNPLATGWADWVSFPVQVIPQDGVNIVDPQMHLIPEPTTVLLAVMACVCLGGLFVRR